MPDMTLDMWPGDCAQYSTMEWPMLIPRELTRPPHRRLQSLEANPALHLAQGESRMMDTPVYARNA